MSINLHSLLLDCNPKVVDVYFKLLPQEKVTKDTPVGGTKADKVHIKAAEFKAQGKSTERALADALEFYKLSGAVNA